MGRSRDLSLLAVTAASFILLIATVQPVSGIKCWECNSAYDYRCADEFNNQTTQLVDCDQRTPWMGHLPLDEDLKPYTATLCRKTVQTTDEHTRVVRGCGWIPNIEMFRDRDCFTRTGTNKINVFHCVCKGDGCNSANQFGMSSLLLLLPIAAFHNKFY